MARRGWNPSPEEIRQGCLEIQKTWSRARLARSDGSVDRVPYTIPSCSVIRSGYRRGTRVHSDTHIAHERYQDKEALGLV